MTSMMPVRTGTEVLTGLARHPSAEWTARLHVDENDPLFFDHPLDHVPAMLLMEAVIRLAERASTAAGPGTPGVRLPLTDLRLHFTRLCEKDPPAHLAAAPAEGGRELSHRVWVTQHGRPTCTGEVSLAMPVRAVDRLDVAPAADRPPRAAAALVHKLHPESVLVGPLARDGGGLRCAVLAPPAGQMSRIHPAALLVEPVRQFTTMMCHVTEGIPLGWQFLLTSLNVSFAAMPEPMARLHLWSRESPKGRRARRSLVEIRTDAGTAGSVEFAFSLVPKSVYARLREAGRI
jgi:2-oxo-3-(phosphooxy)propyl 3-oxoalkanoate synthase